jgi:DNA-binding transcriptional LysR family regulator
MDRFLLMHSFARVIETGGFPVVARELGTGQPNISRHIAALERHLGTRLLYRSTPRTARAHSLCVRGKPDAAAASASVHGLHSRSVR